MSSNSAQKIRGLYALCDQSYRKDLDHVEMASQLLAGGVNILQLRMKGAQDLKKISQTAKAIMALKKQYEFTFILNDFVELGLELGVDGIHVGQDDMSLTKLRGHIQERRSSQGQPILLGYSSHSLREAKDAEAAGADYVALGAIFPTATKGPGHPVVGVTTLKQVVQSLQVPVVAIGGIDKDNFKQVQETGVAAIAMIGGLTHMPNITQATQGFVKAFDEK